MGRGDGSPGPIPFPRVVAFVQEENLAEQKSIVDVSALERELQTLGEEKRKAEDEVVRLQRDLSAISQQASVRGALEAFRRDKKTKEEQLQNE